MCGMDVRLSSFASEFIMRCAALSRRLLWTKLSRLPASTPWRAYAVGLWVFGHAAGVWAAPMPATAVPGPTTNEAAASLEGQAAQAEAMDKPLRGVSMQAHVGGGYTVMSQKIGVNTTFPQLTGQSELLGAGPAVDVTLGVDILSWLSLQLTGGMTLSGARRADYVHSLSQSYGAVGVRFAVPFRDRWVVNFAPAVGYFRQDDEVDQAKSGVGLMGQVGAEYYAHVRHFSVGADLAVQAPLAPTRVFIGVMPHVRYTF